jgi:hypothetical protein
MSCVVQFTFGPESEAGEEEEEEQRCLQDLVRVVDRVFTHTVRTGGSLEECLLGASGGQFTTNRLRGCCWLACQVGQEVREKMWDRDLGIGKKQAQAIISE